MVDPKKIRRVRFYREFLTPALHRRFTRAAGLVLFVCYLEAVTLSFRLTFLWSWSSFFWSWFPFGSAGMKALLLFISGLVIFVLRVAQLRFGARTTTSQLDTTIQSAYSWSTLQTFAFYLFSAWWFGEVYVWSAPYDSNLGWVTEGKSYERPRLNERSIYLRSHFFVLAVAETLIHIYYDYDQIPLPISASNQATGPFRSASPLDRLWTTIPRLLQVTCTKALIISGSSFVTYYFFLRKVAWNCSLWFVRLVWSIPSTAQPSSIPPYHLTLIGRSILSGILLLSLWDLSNIIFTTYVAQQPLKKGNPLSNDSSDPNGSLLNGLKSRKQTVRTFAFWELSLISSNDFARRKTIYSEFDRTDGSTWTLVLQHSLAVIEEVSTRIISRQNPPPELTLPDPHQKTVKPLPKLSAPLQEPEAGIFAASPAPSGVASFARSIGQSPPPPGQPSSPVQKYLEVARDRLLTEQQRKSMTPDNLFALLLDTWTHLFGSQAGSFFRQTFACRTRAKVLGTPRSDLGPIIFAIDSVAKLALASIEEDSYGTVYKDIPPILRTFANITNRIETFVKESPAHWTDVDFREEDPGARKVEEIDLVVGHLKAALRQLVEKYEGYAREMGLGQGEMRAARRAAGMPLA